MNSSSVMVPYSAANLRKHGVSFQEARTVFLDENALLRPDEDHSDDEDRFVLLGLSGRLRTLVVCHCYRQEDEVIRARHVRRTRMNDGNTTTGG